MYKKMKQNLAAGDEADANQYDLLAVTCVRHILVLRVVR